MKRITGFYDWICELSEKETEQVQYTDMMQLKNMLIVSVIEEARFNTYISGLLDCNPYIKLTVIVQDYVSEGFLKSFGNRCDIIPWKGPYSKKILDAVDKETLSDIDSFTFFSDFAVNMRDQNFIEIADELNKINSISLYSCTIGNDIYIYKNIEKYRSILKCFEAVCELIDYCIE